MTTTTAITCPIAPVFYRIADVRGITGLPKHAIYSAAARNQFPRPRKLTERRSAWLAAEIDAWCVERIAATSRGRS